MKNAILWMDHQHAHLVHVTDDKYETQHLHGAAQHLHNKADHHGGQRGAADPKFLAALEEAIGTYDNVYLVGPGNAKDEWVAGLKGKHSPLLTKITAVESADHPTEGELANIARAFFKKHGKMGGVHV